MGRDLDQIVDAVADRIKSRLTGGAAASPPAAGDRHPLAPPAGTAAADASAPDTAGTHYTGGTSWRRPEASKKPWLRRTWARDEKADTGEGAPGGAPAIDRRLARLIDHTQLRANATRDEILTLCQEARQYGFYSVCVNSTNVPLCAEALAGGETVVCAVVGFPLGAMSPSAKAYEAREAVRQGAGEIDMVLNIGALKSGDYALVLGDIREVVRATEPGLVKVILEASSLSDEEKAIACALSKTAGAGFVKTSTGFGGGGATADDVRLMKRIVGDDVQVKASGGVKSRDDAQTMLDAGATRIGTSSSVAIVTTAASGQGRRGRR